MIVRIHYVDDLLPEDTPMGDGIPVTSPARTLLDLAPCFTETQMKQMLENALSRDLTMRAELLRAIARHPKHPGEPRVAALL